MSLGAHFEVSDPQARSSVSPTLPAVSDPDTELSATSPVLCLLMGHHASHHDDNGPNL